MAEPATTDALHVEECEAPEDYNPPNSPAISPEDWLEADAIPPPPVSAELEFPTDGLFGYYDQSRKFGIAEVVNSLKEAGRIWHARQKLPAIGIGDVSKKNGGQISGHASHQRGVDVDIRPVMRDNKTGPVKYQDADYSRELTQEWIDILHANGVLAVKFIFFNDSAVANVSQWPNHDNHLHVRFFFPGERQAFPTLSVGVDHPAVRDAQRRLNFWIGGGDPGIALLRVDGGFGARTRDAVRAFQTANRLNVDGRIARGGTWEALPKAPAAATGPNA